MKTNRDKCKWKTDWHTFTENTKRAEEKSDR